MQTITLEPLRWQDESSRITVHANDSNPSVFYQITNPLAVEPICCGRPVEELPRILPMLAPAHHLAAAQALDRLFEVDPPELARNMRSALLQAQFCSSHLRRLYFLLTSRQDPFADFHVTGRGVPGAKISKRRLEAIMHHAALAQEAEDILGGRHDHPLTAVAGGVSRYLKEGHYERLAEIGQTLLPFALELAAFIRSEVLAEGGMLAPWADIDIPALTGLHLAADGQVALTPAGGGDGRSVSGDRLGEMIDLQREAWTYQPFAYLKENGWQGLEPSPGLFHVGPLARFNAGLAASTPLAEEERQRLIETLAAPPVYKLTAVFGQMAVEIVQAAEILQELSSVEKLGGPSLRTIPTRRNESAWAALEAPQGLIWHHYRVDGDGLVQAVTVIDVHAANNALKCLLARQVVGAALAQKKDPAAIKAHVAVALLPF